MSEPATPTPEAGTEHDAWLREALRHAPDASAAPPLSLREAILAEARAATRIGPRPAPPPSLADRFAALWSWLARPPVAAGFASVMAATLVGLMWWDRPLDEMAPPPPEPVAAARARASVSAAVPPTLAPAAPPSIADQATATTSATAQNAPAEALRPAPTAHPATAERATTADRAERERRGFAAAPQSQPPTPVAATAEKANTAADALGEGRKDADLRRSNAAPATAAAPTAPAAPAPIATPAATAAPSVSTPPSPFPARDTREGDAQAPAQTQTRSESAALAKKAGKAEKSDAEEKRQPEVAQNRLASAAPAPTGAAAAGALEPSPGASSDGGTTAGRFAAAPRPAPAARQRAAEVTSTTARPMAPLLAALSNDGSRWSRTTPAGETVAADASSQAWLARVDAAAASQWQSTAERPSRLDAAPADASTLLLYRDGRVAAIVRIDDAGVYFEARPGPAWYAALTPDVVARLRATLPAATR